MAYVKFDVICDKHSEHLELELELDASVDPSHPTDDNGEES